MFLSSFVHKQINYISEIDLIPFFTTLLSCVFFSLEYGILIGLGSNLIFVLYLSARPAVAVEKHKLQHCDVFVATPCRSMQYPAAEFVRERVMEECSGANTVVVLDGKYIKSIDSTVAKVGRKNTSVRGCESQYTIIFSLIKVQLLSIWSPRMSDCS